MIIFLQWPNSSKNVRSSFVPFDLTAAIISERFSGDTLSMTLILRSFRAEPNN